MNLLELAEKAGLAVGYQQHLATTSELQAFADLVLEEAAKVCEAKAADVLAKQTPERGETDVGVNQNLRLIAVLLPDCADAIRALKGGK
jgi:hypothetical protein